MDQQSNFFTDVCYAASELVPGRIFTADFFSSTTEILHLTNPRGDFEV